MSPGQASKKAANTASAAARDPFQLLPEQLIQHVLCFLPVQEAVSTCVLARRWRKLWEGATGLRITPANAPQPPPPLTPLSTELRNFVDHLFLLRGDLPLDTCEFMFQVRGNADSSHVNMWIRYVILCKVRRLRLNIYSYRTDFMFNVDNLPIISRHLTRLEIIKARLNGCFLDFSRCPGLEDLVIHDCCLQRVKRISSKSVKHLSVEHSVFGLRPRTYIDVPSIVSLRLVHLDSTPMLGTMPLLADAFVRLGKGSWDFILTARAKGLGFCCQLCDHQTADCTCTDINNNQSVLLQGLSEAKSLVLIDEFETPIFEKDMKFCPTFRKLKTLSLNEYWCVPPDFPALTCILENSPVLEKLTLLFFSKAPEHKVDIIGCHTMEGSAAISAVSENLRMVEVKCEVVDERVMAVLNFMGTLNIDIICEKVKEEALAEDGPTTS